MKSRLDIPFPKFGMVLRIILRQKIDKEKGTSFYSFRERERERERKRERERENARKIIVYNTPEMIYKRNHLTTSVVSIYSQGFSFHCLKVSSHAHYNMNSRIELDYEEE